jgi:hypothetical protein
MARMNPSEQPMAPLRLLIGFWQWPPARISRIDGTLERACGPSALNHDQIIVLVLEAGCGKVRSAGAQQPPVDLVALLSNPQKLQLPQKPPRHEKNAGTDPDCEQHSEHCTDHPRFLSFTLGRLNPPRMRERTFAYNPPANWIKTNNTMSAMMPATTGITSRRSRSLFQGFFIFWLPSPMPVRRGAWK